MSLLHYTTYKLVTIRDKRLGVVYYVIAILILLYTLIEIFFKKGYLEFDAMPKGTMRILVSDHLDDPEVTMTIPKHMPIYCCNKTDVKSLVCDGCESIDAHELSWPVESKVLSLTTFCKDRWQIKHKNHSVLQQNYVTVRERKYHPLNPESVMLKIEHSVVATHLRSSIGYNELAGSQRALRGFLFDVNGNIIKSMSSNAVSKQKGQADKLAVQDLLQAAGVGSLDKPSDALNAKGKSLRRHGLVLQVVIEYHNSEKTWIGTGAIEYSYHVRRIPFADYRINQVIPVIRVDDFILPKSTDNDEQEVKDEARLFRKRYGIKIEFFQRGKLGRFCLSALIIKLVAAVGLLTLTNSIVDIAALYVLPDRCSYQKFVYEESPVIQKNSSAKKTN